MKRVVKLLSIVITLILALTIGLCACNKNDKESNEITLSMPDGTPALSVSQFLGSEEEIVGASKTYKVKSSIIATSAVPTQLAGELSDMLIVPTNAGANAIKQGAKYKLAAVLVQGSLYIVGKGEDEITLASLKDKKLAMIGKGNTPEKVFNYLVNNTEGINLSDINIEACDDATAAIAALSRVDSPCDYALVGEPAATAIAAKGFTNRLNIQTLYKQLTGNDNFPQASLFVKSSLYEDKTFMDNLFAKIESSQTWIKTNASTATAPITLDDELSTSKFPPAAVSRCAICVLKASSSGVQKMITDYLNLVVPTCNWAEQGLF